MQAFDDRLVIVTIEIEGQTFVYDQRYYITATGEKYAAPNLGIGEVRIDNIKKETRDYFLTKTSLYKPNQQTPTPAFLSLDVGRESIGTFRLFTAQVIAGTPSQPPDIGLVFRAMTGAALLGQPLSVSMPANTYLSAIAEQVARNLNKTLSFQVKPDRVINNYSFTGSAIGQLQRLEEMGNVDVFIDNTTLIVKNSANPRAGAVPLISSATGMVGVPQITERGVWAKCLINSLVQIGGAVTIQSEVNPATSGTWNKIFKLGFEIASRDTPFYWIIEANNSPLGFAA